MVVVVVILLCAKGSRICETLCGCCRWGHGEGVMLGGRWGFRVEELSDYPLGCDR